MSIRVTNGEYFTKNLYLACYLEAEGYNIRVEPDPEMPGKVVFYVLVDEALEERVDTFYRKEALVEPIAFCVAMKNLKGKKYELMPA